MTTLVLCDGSEGSLRAIELACAGYANPSSPISPGEASLILAHVWDTSATRRGTANADSSSMDTRASRRSTCSGAAAPSASAGAGGHGGGVMACGDVLTTTLRYIHANKYLKNKLHYRMETACASAVCVGGGADGSVSPEAAGDQTGGAAALQAARGKAEHAQKRSSCWSGGSGAGAAGHRSDQRPLQRQTDLATVVPGGVSSGAGSGTAPEGQHAAICTPENEMRAVAVVKYAAARAAHHHATAILLGVGQRQDGKVCVVGAVARRVLLELRGAYTLHYVKEGGVRLRPGLAAATPLRFTIVVSVPADAPWGSAAVTQTSPGDEAAAPQTTALIATPPAPPPQVPKHVQEAVAAAAQYVQTRWLCPHPAPQVGQITFAVVATSSSQGGDGTAEPDRGENGGEAASGLDAVGGQGGLTWVSPLESYRRYLEALPVIRCNPGSPTNVAASSLFPTSSINPASVSEADAIETQQPEHAAAAAGAGGSGATAPAPQAATSPVTVCALKASKKTPYLSLDAAPEVALPQIVKQVCALKPHMLVMPTSLVPESLQLALLATSNPHCVVLPL
ncbi:hypothetical protein MNV84_01499 [Leishmania braziliensis]|nr:hypothetical protein MNV84_01499 [Leishmania braziliensis]